MKAQPTKPKAKAPVHTTTSKAKSAARPVKTSSASKPAAKPAAKVTPKKATKPAAKPVAKTAAKPVAKAKAPAKPVAKPKAAAKQPAKSPPRAPAKPAKPTAKATVKSPLKSAAKPVAKPAATKPVAKPVAVAAKPSSAKPAAPAAARPEAKAAAPAAILTAIGTAAAAGKPGRPSSRLAQITVPSMAQSVASTAAKASYTQIMSTPVLIPPPPLVVKKDPKLANNWKTKPADQMTDAEVMAMPDTEYMNEKQLAFFRRRLVILKQDILNSAGETTEHLREDTVVVPDPADRATIEEEHALELRTRDRERKLLKKIEQSINQIDSGDYGYCDETGEPIGVGRLLARPTATLSLEAQQRRELKQKMFGD